MAKYFDDVFDSLKRAGQLMATAAGLQQQAADLQTQAMGELVAVADAAIGAHDEQEDLRESVARLEHLVLNLVKDIRDLRERNGRP